MPRQRDDLTEVKVELTLTVPTVHALAQRGVHRQGVLIDVLRTALQQSTLAYGGVTLDEYHVTRKRVHKVWPFRDSTGFWNQIEVWVDKHGTVHQIDEMELDYVANVVYMLNNQEHIVRHSLPLGWDGEPQRVTELPLYKALSDRLRDASIGRVQRPYPRPSTEKVWEGTPWT